MHGNFKDLTGKVFGKLAVIRLVGKNKSNSYLWLCLCECGKETEATSGHIVSGHTRSCGCAHIVRLEGQRFGRLLVVKLVEFDKGKSSRWQCICDCGNTTVVLRGSLTNNLTKSCGLCGWSADVNVARCTTHGYATAGATSSTYTSWRSMKARCGNPNNPHFNNYGGANPPVTYAPEWEEFEPFLDYLGPRPPGTTLGRAMDLGNYEPGGNCWWQTWAEQGAEKKKKYAYMKTFAQAA